MTAIESSFAGCVDFKAVRCPDNIGFAAGANLPFDRGLVDGCEFVLFLNNDTILKRDFLTRMVESAEPKMIVVPKILYTDDHRLISTHAGGFDWRLGVFRHTFAGRPDGPATSVRRDGLATASFCCALVPVQAFRDAGGLDERFFMYLEDTDLCRRFWEKRWRVVYHPKVAMVHYHRRASDDA